MDAGKASVFGPTASRFVALFVVTVLFAAPLLAQQPAAAPARPTQRAAAKPVEAFDTLLAADSYKVYGEVRNVGQLLSTGGAGEIVEPIMRLADPPKEFTALIKFLRTNADTLATSRLLFASWPARTGIPDALVAIELPSPEEAEKFEPKLTGFLPIILPAPTPTPAKGQAQPAEKPDQAASEKAAQPVVERPSPEKGKQQAGVTAGQQIAPPPPFVVTRSGNLIFVSDKPFKFEKLHPATGKLLAEDQNFQLARNRFATESVFLYFNVALEDKTKPKPTPPSVEEIARTREEEATEAAKTANSGTVTKDTTVLEAQGVEVHKTVTVQTPVASASAQPTPTPTQAEKVQSAASSGFGSLFGLLTAGETEWPDAVGVALSQEIDVYVVRSILLGPLNGKQLPLPFIPQLRAGRGYTPEAPTILPDDTEIFVSMSLDLPHTYEGMLTQLAKMNEEQQAQGKRVPTSTRSSSEVKAYDPFAEFEKKGGFKIKDDLLPALGNEITVAASLQSLQGMAALGIQPPPSASPSPSPDAGPNGQAQPSKPSSPVFLISIRDRDAARRLMPLVLDGLGAGEANLIAQTERREDTELTNFAGAFAYAFVGNFLVVSDTATVKHVVDSYLSRQTLAGNGAFRNFTRWQGRETLGQIYVSPALMESYQKALNDPKAPMSASVRDFLMELNPTPQAITYTLSNDGLGTVHELHLPKALVLAMVAGSASATKEQPPEINEAIAISFLHMVASAETTYQGTTGKGSYGSLDQLVAQKLISKDMFEKYGYSIAVTASGNQFEATATPVEYGKTGRRSFFVDQTGVIRGDDHGGGMASAADKPAQQ
jgi:hypothetical protein